MVHQQQTTFAPLIPGIIRIVPNAARKKQRIDLRAVRANRGERRSRGATQPPPQAAGREKEKVGQKRRRDEDEDDEREEEVEGGGADEIDGDVVVDEAEEVTTSGEEVATSGAEGDIESAAELDGDTTSVET